MDDFQKAILEKFDLLIAAVQKRKGGGKGGGSGKKRSKPKLEDCSVAVGYISAVGRGWTNTDPAKLYAKLAMERQDGRQFQLNAFEHSCDVDAVIDFAEKAKESGQLVAIYFQKKEDSKYSDFVELTEAGAQQREPGQDDDRPDDPSTPF